MAEFRIEIKEYLSRIVKIEADSVDEAIAEASKRYKEGGIVLDERDFVIKEIQPLAEE